MIFKKNKGKKVGIAVGDVTIESEGTTIQEVSKEIKSLLESKEVKKHLRINLIKKKKMLGVN